MRLGPWIAGLSSLATTMAAFSQAPTVVVKRESAAYVVKLTLPAPPGFVGNLERFTPRNALDRRRFRFQLRRLLTFASGRWVPDTTSFATIFRSLEMLPVELKNRVVMLAAVGPAAQWAQGWVRRQFRRHHVRLVEPSSLGIRLRPVRVKGAVRLWHEWRVTRRSYSYVQIPALRVTGFYTRSPTYQSVGVWYSTGRGWAVAAQHARARTWDATTISLGGYWTHFWMTGQAQHIRSRWAPGWQFVLSWLWIPD